LRSAKSKSPRATKKTPKRERALAWDEARERREFQATVRSRLRDLFEQSNIPERGRTTYLAAITHRSKQATSRWLRSGPAAGSPDPIAIRQLALAFDVDPAFLMGLSEHPRRVGRGVVAQGAKPTATWQSNVESWFSQVDSAMGRRSTTSVSIVMDNDEMEPTIRRGALVLINPEQTSLEHSGLYAVRSNGRTTVRAVENRLGGGTVLSCSNSRYSELVLTKLTDLKRHDIAVIGRVEGCLEVNWI